MIFNMIGKSLIFLNLWLQVSSMKWNKMEMIFRKMMKIFQQQDIARLRMTLLKFNIIIQ